MKKVKKKIISYEYHLEEEEENLMIENNKYKDYPFFICYLQNNDFLIKYMFCLDVLSFFN